MTSQRPCQSFCWTFRNQPYCQNPVRHLVTRSKVFTQLLFLSDGSSGYERPRYAWKSSLLKWGQQRWRQRVVLRWATHDSVTARNVWSRGHCCRGRTVGPPPLDVQSLTLASHVGLSGSGSQLHDVLTTRSPSPPPPPSPSSPCSSPPSTRSTCAGYRNRPKVNKTGFKINLKTVYRKIIWGWGRVEDYFYRLILPLSA